MSMKYKISNCHTLGKKHDECQDYTGFIIDNDVYAIALADGLSTEKMSAKGAMVAVDIACKDLVENFDNYYDKRLNASDFTSNIYNRTLIECQTDTTHGYKSTLLVCAIKNDRFLLGHIGDGAILAFGKSCSVIMPPQENSVGGSATYTILDENAGENFEFLRGDMADFDGFLLTSDGLSENVFYSGSTLPELAYLIFGQMFNNNLDKNDGRDRNEYFETFINSYIHSKISNSDDCSLAIISRLEPTGYVDYSANNGFSNDLFWPCICGKKNDFSYIKCSNPDCRKMYFDIYSADILRIINKEQFFYEIAIKLKDFSQDFEAGNNAEIYNQEKFDRLLNNLYKAQQAQNEEIEEVVNNDKKGDEKESVSAKSNSNENELVNSELDDTKNAKAEHQKKISFTNIENVSTNKKTKEKARVGSFKELARFAKKNGKEELLSVLDLFGFASKYKVLPPIYAVKKKYKNPPSKNAIKAIFNSGKSMRIIGNSQIFLFSDENNTFVLDRKKKNQFRYEAIDKKDCPSIIENLILGDDNHFEHQKSNLLINFNWKDYYESEVFDAKYLLGELTNHLRNGLSKEAYSFWCYGLENNSPSELLIFVVNDGMVSCLKSSENNQLEYITDENESYVDSFFNKYLLME